MFSRNENRNEVRSDVPPERKTGTRVRSNVPRNEKLERGYVRQNHPFTKPPFYLPVTISGCPKPIFYEVGRFLDRPLPPKVAIFIGFD